MPYQIGASLGITLPTPGGDFGVWGSMLNDDVLQRLIDSVEGGVSSAVGLTITGAVDFEGFNADDLGALYFANKSSAFSTAGYLYKRSKDLWYNDDDGNQIQLTADGALNAASLGGIVGDYGGGNPASVSFNDANGKYIFTTDPGVYAAVEVGSVRLIALTSGHAMTVKAPDSLSGATTLTLPEAPASTSVVTMTSAGAFATTLTPSVTTLTATGAISGGTVATAGADVIRGEATDLVHALECHSAAATLAQDADGRWQWEATTGAVVAIPLKLREGTRLKSIVFRVVGSAAGVVTCTIVRNTVNADPSVATSIWSSGTSSGASAQTVTLTGTVHTVSSVYSYTAYAQFSVANFAGQKFLQAQIVTDRTA